MHHQTPGDILTLQECADILRVDVKSLRRIIARGDGPPVFRVGNRVRIHARDLDKFTQPATPAGR